MEKHLLIEEPILFEYTLVEEDGGNPDVVRVRGKFQQADAKNKNGRVYSKGLWESILSNADLKSRIKERCMYGELGHPKTGITEPHRVSHLITHLEMDKHTGAVLGEAEILDTQPNGVNLKELFRKKCKVGISSRGHGSVVKKTGMVAEDFDLDTFDFVLNPSTFGAYPEAVQEDEPDNQDIHQALAEAKQFVGQLKLDITAMDNGKLIESTCRLLRTQVELGRIRDAEESLRNPVSEVVEDIKGIRTVIRDRLSRYMSVDVLDALDETITTAKKSGDGKMEDKLTKLNEDISKINSRLSQLETLKTPGSATPDPEDAGSEFVTELSEVYKKLLESKEDFVLAEKMMDVVRDKYQGLTEALQEAEADLEAAKEIIEAQSDEISAGGDSSDLEDVSEDLEACKKLAEYLHEKLETTTALYEEILEENRAMREIIEGAEERAEGERRERILSECLGRDPRRRLWESFLRDVPTDSLVERVEQLKELSRPGARPNSLFEDAELGEDDPSADDDDLIVGESEDERAPRRTAGARKSLTEREKSVRIAKSLTERINGK